VSGFTGSALVVDQTGWREFLLDYNSDFTNICAGTSIAAADVGFVFDSHRRGLHMGATARELADRIVASRRKAWDKSDPTVAVVSTEQLNPEDEVAVRRMVAEDGYTGNELEEMVRKVSLLVVGKVEALADDMPTDSAD
jgi:hypothetical protein